MAKKELPAEQQYNYDPKKAKALLAEAGHPNGVTIPCFTSQREDYASLMLMLQEQLRAAGINLDLKIIDHATMHAENRKDRNSVALYSSSFPPVPTQPFLQLLSAAAEVKADGTGAENYSHYGVAIPGIDALIEKAQDEPDFNKRIALIQDIEKQVLRDLPAAGDRHPLLRHRTQSARRHGIPGQVRLRLLASEQSQARLRPVEPEGQAMLRVIGARLLDAVPTVLLVLTLVFIALRLLPGDPALVALGDYATPEQLALFREQMGLNVPLWQQYFLFIWDMLSLDFGQSLIDRRPVLQLLADNLPYTIELTLVATGMGLFIGVPLGVIAAVNRNRLPDAGVRVFSLVGYAVPDFYLGALLLIVFALNLGWFPINGGGTGFIDRMYHVFLPAVTLAMVKTAFLGRLTRTSLLEVLGKDYIRTARAKGARENRVIYRHGLRNALLPVATGLGLSVLATLSGSVAIELVFNRPGIGEVLISAIAKRDYPVIQAGVVVFAFFVVLVNLLVDLAYIVVDPRIRVK